MANPTAVPATVVPSGALLTPAGGRGYLGIPGTPGLATLSADSGNAATLGSDSRIFVPGSPLADNTKNGLLRPVSGSTRDLINGTNNCAEVEIPATYRKRYYYCWHCDHPPSATQANGIAGAGSSVGQTISEANHPGIYNLVTGAVANAYAYYASNTLADLQLGFFTKLSFRAVFKAPASIPIGTPTDQNVWAIGFVDTLGALTPANMIAIEYDATNTGDWQLHANKATATTYYDLVIGPLANTWYDIQLYWDANGVRTRIGVWNGVTLPTLSGPYTLNIPAITTNLFWYVGMHAGGGATTAYTGKVDLIEIAGELATPGGFRGEELVTNF